MGDDGRSRKTAMEYKADAIPDELLGLVFVRLTKPVDLVRAMVTCRRWRHIIVAESFRVLCALQACRPPKSSAATSSMSAHTAGVCLAVIPSSFPLPSHLGRGPPQGIWRLTSSLGRKTVTSYRSSPTFGRPPTPSGLQPRLSWA
ncbi:hypothetical protein QYE76_011179 [Lolium multiflorum]|uniref:F-box domain-containing protein n=1 Tax=Lolium multiflorum TaxID=4521 RepID=A0AAD8TYP1_LOLMU|nr:hypothetical protein QYE76_011179 [Lolium multiflorum]